MANNLDAIAEEIRKVLMARDEAREKLIPLSREVIRHCSGAIRAVHRNEFARAREMLDQARQLLSEAEKAVAGYGEPAISGIIRDAQKEFAEGSITLALVEGRALPRPEELRVDVAAYLNGMGEAVGELRRYLLDAMRRGDLSRGEELLAVMDDIYNVLITMDFPDAITGGLRRTTDVVRGVLEGMRRDLTLAIRQEELEARLAAFLQGQEIDDGLSAQLEAEKTGEASSGTPLDSEELKLYQALDAWRTQKANEENLAPYIIARNSWLHQIIKLRPKTPKDLYAIKGFGERRVNKYGREIIAIVSEKH